MNGAQSLAIAENGAFFFPTGLPSGADFTVSVQAAPSGPSQTCTLTHGSGAVGNANVSNVLVNCVTDAFAVGAQVSGLLDSPLTLQLNGANDLAVPANGAVTFPGKLLSGANYSITVLTQPTDAGLTCTVADASGTVGSADVLSPAVHCVGEAPAADGAAGTPGGTATAQ